MTSRLQSPRLAIKAALASANTPVSRFYVFVPGKLHIPGGLVEPVFGDSIICEMGGFGKPLRRGNLGFRHSVCLLI
jgi:hypothetical protein